MKYELHLGDCLEVLKTLPVDQISAVVSDPPYGMEWDTDSTRFSDGRALSIMRKGKKPRLGQGRQDWGAIEQDAQPFDPSPWLGFPKVVLFGANHYAQRLPVGTTLVWIKKADHLFETFLSDAEIAWQKGGHGVYCFRKQFPPPSRMAEHDGLSPAHPTQKPIELMKWCIQRLKLPPNSLILDPYMGSGTTGVAAAQLGHRFIGIELDPTYHAIAEKRIAAAYAQERLLI